MNSNLKKGADLKNTVGTSNVEEEKKKKKGERK